MKIKFKKCTLALCILMLWVVLLSGCSSNQTDSSSSLPSAPSSGGESTSAPVSSKEEASSSEISSSEPASSVSSPEPSQESSEENPSGHSGFLPDISAEDPAFAEIFSGNPLDENYTAELENAASAGKMIEILNKYIALWKEEVDAAYQTLMKETSGETKAAIRREQEVWVNETAANLQKIEEQEEGDGSARQLNIASEVMAYYRARAATLYSQLFQIHPDFSFACQGE